ncbi:MAG: EI24 domain-containing protein [Planctomycetes bacterium]|nr:EI24 domain-containing protein [Planctomycetota bacterium]
MRHGSVRYPVGSFLRGFFSPLRALRLFLAHPGLKRYALLPLLVNIVIFGLILAITIYWILPGIDLSGYVPESDAWYLSWFLTPLKWVVTTFKWLFGLATIFFLFFYGFTAIGLVIASPFNDLLSEKVEGVLQGGGGQAKISLFVWGKATLFSLWESTKIAIWQLFFTLLTLPFLLLPIIGAAPLFVVNAYFGGLGFMDVALARHFLGSRHRQAGFAGRKMEIFGLGTAMVILMAIPLVGLLTLPLGVVAATILYCEIDWAGRLNRYGIKPPPGFIPPKYNTII